MYQAHCFHVLMLFGLMHMPLLTPRSSSVPAVLTLHAGRVTPLAEARLTDTRKELTM